MHLDKSNMKKLSFLLILTVIVYCGLDHLGTVIGAFKYVLGVFVPFLVGGAMAFVLNIPMRTIEAKLFPQNVKLKKLRRPLAFLITLLLLAVLLVLVAFVVIPEMGRTFLLLADQIPDALRSLEAFLNELSIDWPQIQIYINELDIDWANLSKKAVAILQDTTTTLVN
ncbi:MAG: AI-2E family transporter, partial [Firmicutes bacterium]|nr:AI-2E family transporter [Bacillota bacterium]